MQRDLSIARECPSGSLNHKPPRAGFSHVHGPSLSAATALWQTAGDYSLFSRRMPSMIGCQPNTSVTMKPSMRMSVGALSLTVDL